MMRRLNFIPDTYRRTKAMRRHLVRWSLTVVVSVLALGVVWGLSLVQRAQAGNLLAQQDEVAQNLKQERQELEATKQEAKRVQIQLERARALQTKRSWSGIYGLLARTLPEDSWLTSVATDPPQPLPGERKIKWQDQDDQAKSTEKAGPPIVTIEAPRKLIIKGYAPEAGDPHRFVTALKDEKVFPRITLVKTSMERAHTGTFFAFELVCEW